MLEPEILLADPLAASMAKRSREQQNGDRKWAMLSIRLRAKAQAMLDRGRLRQAFQFLGEDLVGKGVFLEIAVYGGSAIVMQFEWRRSTEDVDAVVRQGYDERALGSSTAQVAKRMGLSTDWLNNAVGMFTPLDESDALFEASGTFPDAGDPGLRVLVAKPHYLLAMKLKALASLDRGDRDLSDARNLALELGVTETEKLRELYVSIHDEEPPDEIAMQFDAVLGAG